MYNYNYSEDYLMHYGVKGMKWGVRRASKLQSYASGARESAAEQRELSKHYAAKGRYKKADKHARIAAEQSAKATKYQQKADAKVEKRYAKAGRYAGAADYARDRAKEIEDSHNRGATVLDKTANRLESEGKYFRAEAARTSANAMRAKGANDANAYRQRADAYMKKSNTLNKKAGDFATTTKINVGKKKIDSILSTSRQTGYKNAKAGDEYQRETDIENKYGSVASEIYKRTRK